MEGVVDHQAHPDITHFAPTPAPPLTRVCISCTAGWGGSHLLLVEPDLEPVEHFIWPEDEAAGVLQRVQVAMP